MGRKDQPRPVWWNEECEEAIKYREKCRKKCIRIKSGPKYERLREARRQVRRAGKKAKLAVGWIPEYIRREARRLVRRAVKEAILEVEWIPDYERYHKTETEQEQ